MRRQLRAVFGARALVHRNPPRALSAFSSTSPSPSSPSSSRSVRDSVCAPVPERWDARDITLRFVELGVKRDEENARRTKEDSETLPRLQTRLFYLRDEARTRDVFLLGANHQFDASGVLAAQVLALTRPDAVVVEATFESMWAWRYLRDYYLYKLERALLPRRHSWAGNLLKLHALTLWQRTRARLAEHERREQLRGLEVIYTVDAAEALGARVLLADCTDATLRENLEAELARFHPDLDPARVYNLITRGKNFERDVFYMQSKKVDSERFFSDSLAITHTRNVMFLHALQERVHVSAERVLGVFGRGHLDGIVRHWSRLSERIAELGLRPDALTDARNVNAFEHEYAAQRAAHEGDRDTRAPPP